MFAGNFKNQVSGLGDGCTLSAPMVITGERLQRAFAHELGGAQSEFFV
jgi:hypothetical protein